ncbi:GNAT family N-acetyltransferase [Rasiella sp. SM2506]|uniref:GNAT family N-acetyltransferase n=1 Tax=Rasiella sp. SM2506 TaxID=3423914 RepID=UPI003D7C07E2
MNVNIRKAEKKDMPQVLKLIKELAAFEKEPDAVEVTVADLEKEGFDNKLFSCFVAETETEIVGMALVYFRFSTWKGRNVHLEDLVVSEAYRGKGIGTKLYKRVMQFAKEHQVNRAQWIVLNWNEKAIKMYENSGATFHKDWWVVLMDSEGITKNSED